MTVTNSDDDSNVVMSVTGTLRQIRRAFHVRIHQYHHNALNRDFYSAEKDPRLPKRIAGEVRAIIGLDNFARLQNSLTSSRRATNRGVLDGSQRVSRSPIIISPPSWLETATRAADLVGGGKRGNGLSSAISNRAPEHLSGLNAAPKSLMPLFATAFDGGDGGDGTNVAGGNSPNSAFTPMDIKKIYGLAGVTQTGAGQTIGLIEFNPFTPSHINYFCSALGLPSSASQITTSTINPPAGGYMGTFGGEQECELDIEMVLGFAPGANVQVFLAPWSQAYQSDVGNYVAVLSYIVNHASTVPQISTSWSLPESDFYHTHTAPNGRTAVLSCLFAVDVLTMQMAAEGQTLLVATGDHGSYGSNPGAKDSSGNPVDDTAQCPATSGYVTAVGGTYLYATASDGYSYETQWDENILDAGGGGYSAYERQPSYQASVPYLAGQTFRGVPDVSLNAENYGAYTVDAHTGALGWQSLAGTSAAAPLWAAFVALVNQKNQAAGTGAVGFMNPMLYKLVPRMPSVFNDIVLPSASPKPVSSISPAVGFDLSTGWGSINGLNLFNNL